MEEHTLTWAAIISLLISGLVSFVLHKMLVKDISKTLKDLEDTKNENQRLLSKLRYEYDLRKKTEIVAELFALWYQTFPNTRSKKGLSPDEFKRLNQLSYECAFWLPQNILIDLSNRLNNQPEAKDLKEILVDVRTYLNPEIGTIDWRKIIHW